MELKLEEAVAVLERTAPSLRSLLTGMPEPWIRGTEGGDSWSAYQIVGHLIHGEKTDWIPRAHMILEWAEERAFEPFDRFAMLNLPQDRPLEEMLAEFEQLRSHNLSILKNLAITPQQLQRIGRHPDLGPVSLSQLLATWVAHDLGHLSQLARVMAKQYTEAVGPWRAYLPVLDTRLK